MVTAEVLPVDALTAAYDLGSWKSVQLLPGGKSQHCHIITSRGEYVVRRSYRSKTLEDMRFEHELMAYLRHNGFPAPVIVPTIMGDTCVAVDGRLYRVSVYVKGSHYQAGNIQQLQEVARALATYHQLVASFRPSSPKPPEAFLNESLRKRLATMLDFDSAHLEARVLDLAVALHDFAKVYGTPTSPEFKVPLDLAVVSQFLSADQEINPLEPIEIEALPALLIAKRLKRAFGRYERLFEGRSLSQ
jgi:homoserine kinase type II